MLAVLSLVGATSPTTGSLVYVPVFALAVPLLDGAVAITRRWLRSAPIWRGDHRHIHHRVQALGLSRRESLTVLMSAAGVVACAGLMTAYARPGLFIVTAALAGAATVALIGFGLWRLDYYEFGAVRALAGVRPTAWRRHLSEEIRLREAERDIAGARSIDDLRSTLSRTALAFGLDRIEITRSQPKFKRSLQSHLDIALTSYAERGSDVWNLRVWHGQAEQPQEEFVARVGAALSDSCASWLRDFGVAPATPADVPLQPTGTGRHRLSFPRARRLLAKA